MPEKTRSYREALLEALTDPFEAEHYLNAALDDSPEMFLKALRNVTQANQVARVAKKAGVARETLYRSLSDEGNPTLDTLRAILGVLGFKIAVTLESPAPPTGFHIPHVSLRHPSYRLLESGTSTLTTAQGIAIASQHSGSSVVYGYPFQNPEEPLGNLLLLDFANLSENGVVLDLPRNQLNIAPSERESYGLEQETIGANVPIAY